MRGIPWEFVQRMVEADGAEVEHPLGNISHDPECYKIDRAADAAGERR